MKKISNYISNNLYKVLNLYPPYLGAGIKVKALNQSKDKVRVSMKLTKLNKNYVGTHFGGSLYSMCDPFYMLLMMRKLGKEYLVWDKSASIDFISPGRGEVFADFHLTDSQVEDVIKNTEDGKAYKPTFEVRVYDKDDKTVATISKTLWIKKKG